MMDMTAFLPRKDVMTSPNKSPDTAKPNKSGDPALSFDHAIKKLESIVSSLEGGDLPLEKSLDAFEEGMGLAKVCEAKLNEASARVEKIMKDLGGTEKRVALADDDEDEGGDADE